MSRLAEEVAEALAQDVLRQMEDTGDDALVRDVRQVLGSTSVPTEEAFNAAMRVHTADRLARKLMADRNRR